MHVDEQKRKRVLVYSRSAIIIVHERAVRKRILFSSSCCSGVYGWLFNEYTLSYNKSEMKKNRRWQSNVLSFSQFYCTNVGCCFRYLRETIARHSFWSWWVNLHDERSKSVKFLPMFPRNRMPFLNESFQVVPRTFIRRTLTRSSWGNLGWISMLPFSRMMKRPMYRSKTFGKKPAKRHSR